MKGKEGITLIALIITTIVMLILVAVTINVALNGGLFDKAKTAKVGTQKEIEREQLLEAVLGAYNNQGSFVIGSVNLPDEMEWADDNKTAYGSNSITTPSNNGNWVATKNGNYFYIDSYGNILNDEPEEEPVTVSLDGKYYSVIDEVGDAETEEYFTINGTTWEDLRYREGSQQMSITIDTDNKRITRSDEEIFYYEAVIQNNQVINIAIINDDGLEGIKNNSGLTYELEGTYTASNNATLSFNSTTHQVTYTDTKESYSQSYFGINNMYFIGDNIVTVSNNGNSIEYDGDTYTK